MYIIVFVQTVCLGVVHITRDDKAHTVRQGLAVHGFKGFATHNHNAAQAVIIFNITGGQLFKMLQIG